VQDFRDNAATVKEHLPEACAFAGQRVRPFAWIAVLKRARYCLADLELSPANKPHKLNALCDDVAAALGRGSSE